MKRCSSFALTLFLSSATTLLLAQERTEIGTQAASLINDLRASGTEKAFVHINRWSFASGDSIWMKAYCLHSVTHQYLATSKTMYVDLVDGKDSVIKTLLLDIPSQRTDAALPIPASLSSGEYWLRAYTRRMLASDGSGVFVQPVYISNLQMAKIPATTKRSGSPVSAAAPPSLHAAIEGGALIAGFDNWLAIQTTDASGKPASSSGYIKDSRDSIVAKFTTGANGLGRVSLLPWKNRRYTAWAEMAGQRLSLPLPMIDPNAAAIVASKRGAASVHVTVALGDSLYEKKPATRLLVLHRDRLLYAASGKGMYELDIPINSFPGGKASILLLNTEGKILSERAVFADPQPYLAMQTDKATYRHKEKVQLSVFAKDSVLHSEAVRLSIAAAGRSDKERAAESRLAERLINDNIQLPVRGTRISDYGSEDQDIVMLLQQPVFMNAAKSPAKTDTPADADTGFLQVSGLVKDKKNNPGAGKVVVLKVAGNSQLLYTETADSFGRFHFTMPENISDADITLELADDRSRKGDYFIVPDHRALPVFQTPSWLKEQFSPQELNDLKTIGLRTAATGSADADQLQNVDVVSAVKKPTVDFATRISSLSQIIVFTDKDRDDPMAARSLVMRTPGVSLRDGFLVINGGPNSTSMPSVNDEPLVVMDGAPISAATASRSTNESSPVLSLLNNLPAGSIEYIEILSGPSAAAFGERGANGVIAVNTHHGNRVSENNSNKQTVTVHYQGYASQPHFPAAEYGKKPAHNAAPDKRATIAWNGDVLTQRNARYEYSFFTGDAFAEYTLTVFGLSPKGDIIYQQLSLPVSGN